MDARRCGCGHIADVHTEERETCPAEEGCESCDCCCFEGTDEPIPLCASAMGCLCAAHAMGRAASGECDASEDAAVSGANCYDDVEGGWCSICPNGHESNVVRSHCEHCGEQKDQGHV